MTGSNLLCHVRVSVCHTQLDKVSGDKLDDDVGVRCDSGEDIRGDRPPDLEV